MSNQSYFAHYINDSFSFENESDIPTTNLCTYHKKVDFSDLIPLFLETNCYRHSLGFTVSLCVANLLVMLFGILGNFLVLYVSIFKFKVTTASCIFIINMAISDLLVIVSCMPATLLANVFTAWIFSETTCKIVAYTQRLSVFCSVYSLVAISFDRCRAMQASLGSSSNFTIRQACQIVLVIWTLGFGITLPWVFFKEQYSRDNFDEDHIRLAFCQEIWKTSTHEAVYFLLVQVVARFAVPFALISICNVFVWKSLPTSVPAPLLLIPTCIDFRDTQRKRKIRVVKVFTVLNLSFLLFWLPLYVITARLNFSEQENSVELTLEHKLVSYLIPIAQLLGSCNNCLNPVFYCFLSKKFREPLFTVAEYLCCLKFPSRNVRSESQVVSVARFTETMEVETAV